MIDRSVSVEPAGPNDVASVEALLKSVKLPTDGVSANLSDFLVARADGRVIGCVGLEVYGDTAILRSLAVDPARQRGALGTLLAEEILDRARSKRVTRVVLLTETAEGFFARKLGFEVVARDTVADSARQSWQFTGAVCQSATCMSRDISS